MVFQLPRLPLTVRLVTAAGNATSTFQRWWQDVVKAIEAQENRQDALIAAVVAAQAAAAAAQAAADSAQETADDVAVIAEAAEDAAIAAQASADDAASAAASVGSFSDLNLSYASGLEIYATDAGASASVVISSHTRIYQSNPSVSVTGDTLTALGFDTLYYIYYDDPTRAGGAVTYIVTGTEADAFASAANPDRHFVGLVQTPADGDVDLDGLPIGPPGLPGRILG